MKIELIKKELLSAVDKAIHDISLEGEGPAEEVRNYLCELETFKSNLCQIEDPLARGLHHTQDGQYCIDYLKGKEDVDKCVYVFNCLPDKEKQNDILPSTISKILCTLGVDVSKYDITGMDAFYTCWYAMIEEMKYYSTHSIFFVCHGDKDGLRIAGVQESMPWAELAILLQEIEEEIRNRLLFCLCSCEGMNFADEGFFTNVPLYDQLISSYEKLKRRDALLGYHVIFYWYYIMGAAPVELVRRANEAIGKKVFQNQHGPLQAIVNNYCEHNNIDPHVFAENIKKSRLRSN